MRKLVDRVPVVTGAAEGIGRAVAHQLARKGCLLALVDLNVEGLAETAGQISSLGARASVHVADVSNKIAVSRLPEAILSQHGNVHILVNNAGVSLAGPFETIRLEDLEWIFGVNFWGAIFGVTCVYPGAVNTNLVRSGRSWDEQKKEEEAQFVVSRSIPVKKVAACIVRGIEKNSFRTLIGGDTWLIDAMTRLSPTLAAAIIARLQNRMPFL